MKSKILLVDDDPEFLECYSSLLSYERYKVTTADNGQSALEILEQDPDFGIALVDYRLKGTNSELLIKEIRRRFPHLLVFIVTGDISQRESDLCGPQGAHSLMYKPFSIQDLMLALTS